MRKILLSMLCLLGIGLTASAGTVNFDLTKIDGFNSWGTSYSQRTVDFTEGVVSFSSANHQSSTIKDCPVMKGGDVIVTMKDGYRPITKISVTISQWGSKKVTFKVVATSTDGENFENVAGPTAPDFANSSSTLVYDNLPENTVAVKFTNTGTNQMGVKSVEVVYGSEVEEEIVAAPVAMIGEKELADGQNVIVGNTLTLSTKTEGAEVRYSFDATVEPKDFTAYSEPIALNELGECTLRMYGFKENYEDSPLMTYTFNVVEAPKGEKFALVTSNDELKAGDKILIVADKDGKGNLVAMKPEDVASNYVEVIATNDVIVNTEESLVYTLTDSKASTSPWGIYNESIKKYIGSNTESKKNGLTFADECNADSYYAAIDVESTTKGVIKFNHTNGYVYFNATSGQDRFRCFGSKASEDTYKGVQIYKFVEEQAEAPEEPTITVKEGQTGETREFTINVPEGCTVHYRGIEAEEAEADDIMSAPAREGEEAPFKQYNGGKLTIAQGETLEMYAIHNETGLKSNHVTKSYDEVVTTGVAGIEAENGEVRWFNLQGVEISEPAAGIAIRVQGGKAVKVAK